jgi:hypothetical protein
MLSGSSRTIGAGLPAFRFGGLFMLSREETLNPFVAMHPRVQNLAAMAFRCLLGELTAVERDWLIVTLQRLRPTEFADGTPTMVTLRNAPVVDERGAA